MVIENFWLFNNIVISCKHNQSKFNKLRKYSLFDNYDYSKIDIKYTPDQKLHIF